MPISAGKDMMQKEGRGNARYKQMYWLLGKSPQFTMDNK